MTNEAINKRYKEILVPYRLRQSKYKRVNLEEEFLSDRSRVIFSSSFRRMQQKTQVFPLEPNSSIRSRLTHTIEVADISRLISYEIAKIFNKNGKLDKEYEGSFIIIPEIASMIHDLGNPPFGHFGEESIKIWFKENWKNLASYVGLEKNLDLENKMLDFIQFDGNPQSIRIISKLHCERDSYGLNLSLPSILSSIKYTRSTDENSLSESSFKNKAGYFQSEKELINHLYEHINWDKNARYPFAYIMDLADDLAYSFSDISDGIEKKIIRLEEFKDLFLKEWKKNYGNNEKFLFPMPAKLNNFVTDITTNWINKIIPEFAKHFDEKQNDILENRLKDTQSLFPIGYKVLNSVKNVGRKRLYRSEGTEKLEIAGYTITKKMLDHYSILLKLDKEDFITILRGKATSKKDTKIEGRYVNRIAQIYKDSYLYQIKELKNNNKYNDIEEWFLRFHLIIDNLSGMTDESILRQYKLFEGISHAE